jgi:hypothetical protein
MTEKSQFFFSLTYEKKFATFTGQKRTRKNSRIVNLEIFHAWDGPLCNINVPFPFLLLIDG